MQTMYPAQTGSPELTLASDITDTDTVIPVNEDVTQLPSAPNIVTIYNLDSFETILYESVDTTNNELETVTRGFEGTAQSWSSGDSVARLLTSYDIESFKANITENQNNIFSGSHQDLTNLTSSDHHSRYTDDEAQTAINNDSDHGSTAPHNYFSGSYGDLGDVPSSFNPDSHDNSHHSTNYAPQSDLDSHTGSGGTAHADVTTTTDGFMTSDDKSKLDGIESGANDYSLESHNNNHHSTNYTSESDFNSHTGSGGGAHSSATTTTAGFMSDGDKSKLDGIESGANDYSLETHDNYHHSETYATESWVSSNYNDYSLETHNNSHHSTNYTDYDSSDFDTDFDGADISRLNNNEGYTDYTFSESHNDLSNVNSNDHHNQNHGNEDHDSNYTTTSPSDVNSSNWGDYEIQKNGTDGTGIINFKTE